MPQIAHKTMTGTVYQVHGDFGFDYSVEINNDGRTGTLTGKRVKTRPFRYVAEPIAKVTMGAPKPVTVEEPESDDDVPEPNVELDSELFVTWDCFDTLPYLVTLDGIRVNLNYRPAFFPAEGMYRAVGDGDEESYMVEWRETAERCDWRTPCRIVTLDEYNAENVGNVHVVSHDVPQYKRAKRGVKRK